jgi:tripartite-type tricarboxylate transporter receptor subunit TctC
MTTRRRSLPGLGLGLIAGAARAQEEYPSRPLRFIVPRAPGGGSDILTRTLAPAVGARLGQTIVVENRPDATAIVGAEAVARARPDGYTVYVADNSFYFNPAIMPRLPYDTLGDFSGITMLAQAPVVLIVGPSVPAKTLPELIAYGKANPGKLSFASGGVGSSTHFAGVLFSLQAGVQTVHVPYRSSGPALTALLGGDVAMGFGGFASAGQQIRAGTVAAVAKTTPGAGPGIPTFAEAGLAGVDVGSLWGLHAPAGTPIEVRRKLRDAFAAAMLEPAMNERLKELGYEPIGSTPEEHGRQTAETVAKWVEIGRRVNLNQ